MWRVSPSNSWQACSASGVNRVTATCAVSIWPPRHQPNVPGTQHAISVAKHSHGATHLARTMA